MTFTREPGFKSKKGSRQSSAAFHQDNGHSVLDSLDLMDPAAIHTSDSAGELLDSLQDTHRHNEKIGPDLSVAEQSANSAGPLSEKKDAISGNKNMADQGDTLDRKGDLDLQKELTGENTSAVQTTIVNPVSGRKSTVVKDTEEMLDLDFTIAVVMATGVMFLEAGAEVYRAEATMNRLGKSIPGVEDCISYVTVTGIMCSMVSHGQTVTRIARVGSTSRNLSVINAINQLSRNAEQYHFSPQEIKCILDKIVKLPKYSSRSTAFFGALGALGFAVFFNGSLTEVLAVFMIGLLIQLISNWMSRYELNQIFVNGLAAFGAALASEWVHVLFPLAKVDVMIISSIMLLVPGLTMTNAIRDTVMGEYLSGVARGAEALIVATSIAVGVALALAMFMH